MLDEEITVILEEVPTAYDVEKVVAELKQLKIETKTKNYRMGIRGSNRHCEKCHKN